MIRSFRVGKCYAPLPIEDPNKSNDTLCLYAHYLAQESSVREPFLFHCRCYKIDKGQVTDLHAMGKEALSAGVRFQHELKDNYLGQLGVMFLPHNAREDLLEPGADDCLVYVRFLRGLIHYLRGLVEDVDDYVGGVHLPVE